MSGYRLRSLNVFLVLRDRGASGVELLGCRSTKEEALKLMPPVEDDTFIAANADVSRFIGRDATWYLIHSWIDFTLRGVGNERRREN